MTKRVIAGCASFLIAAGAHADIDHFKNILIDGRASTMGGAYAAVSDDAAGAYYNPAGLSLAQGDSISGSAKVFNISMIKYSNAIGTYDWSRDNKNLLPNYFGMVKKYGPHAFAISYAVPDSVIEHQDLIIKNIVSGVSSTIAIYDYNLHSEDTVNLAGPSYSYKPGRNWSFGTTMYYHYRIFRKNLHYTIEYNDGSDEMYYSNSTASEGGLRPKLGIMWMPLEKWSFGLTLARTFLWNSKIEAQQTAKTKTTTNIQFLSSDSSEKRKLPVEITLGSAFFPSPKLLVTLDLDVFIRTDYSDRNVWNLSAGSEFYITPNHAVRLGAYSNHTKKPPVSTSTACPHQHINMYGGTTGYSYFNRDLSITIGGVYSQGSGDAQIFSGSGDSRPMRKYSLSLVTAASYGF